MTSYDGAEELHADVSAGCLSGGGAMGALMRASDWSRGPLGPVASWPTSLQTMASVVLNSRFPMLLWWGPSMVQIYNDAYRPVLGTKHPASLGAKAREVWPEIWDVVGPMAEGVRMGGPATWSQNLPLYLQSHGFPEETFHTFSYSPVRDEQGGVGGVLVTVQETTEEVQNGRQLQMLRDLAASSEGARHRREVGERAARVFGDNQADLPFALVYLLDDGTMPDAVARLAGASGLVVAGAPQAPSLLLVPAVDSAAALFPLREVLATGHPRVVPLRLEVGSVQAGGARLSVPVTRAVVCPLSRAGTVLGFLVLGVNPCRALDDRYLALFGLTADQVSMSLANALAYEQERERAETLAELDRAKTAFFSNVSHEFRTPLTLILGPLEDALAEAPDGARPLDDDAVRALHRNALRLLKLVNTLLDFARIEAGRAEASYEPTDLSTFTSEVASAFQSAVERVGLTFEVTCARLSQPVFVDRDMWEKIVLNLLSNALKFTFEGAIRVHLASLPQGGAVLTVEDTGTGIPQAELPHLFARFRRIEGARSRTHEGSGIGLALVRELVTLHGGDIRVTSAVGVGTRFVVTLAAGSSHLPGDRVKQAAEGAERLEARGALARPFVEEALRWGPGTGRPSRLPGGLPAATSEATRARIVLADDNADMREYVSRLLRDGWAVEAVSDGQQALEALRRKPADLVITDVMMPNMDGFALLEAIRKDPSIANTPVLMLSARAGDDAHVEGLEAGADDYLVKPFSARELVARVRTHLQLRQLREAAVAERSRLNAILMQAPAPVAVFQGPDHRYEVANPSFTALLGRDDLIGLPVRVAHPSRSNLTAIDALDRAYRTGETVQLQDVRFLAASRASAREHGMGERSGPHEEVFFNAIAQPIRNPEGEVTGIIVVAVDVTDQVLARRHVDALRASAEQANRAKDEFLAMLGHELRNPLAPIVTALHLMRLRAGGTATRERVVIERQVSHLTRLVDDLLDVSRITRGKVELKRERLEVAEVVAKAIETASPLLEERNHHLRLDVPAEGFLVDGDPTRLEQVVANLLTNAAKYTDRGGHIEVTLRREADGVVALTVEDDGVGIAEDVLPSVFDTFVQERQSLERSRGGLGLGLTIVRSLVTMHGGTVTAHSAGKGQGSAFVVRLPAPSLSLPPQPASSTPRASTPAPGLPGGKRILIVDDNEDAAELLADALQALGHVTQVAHDALEALRVVHAFTPDVALLDIGLPVMDGYELARRLRGEPTLSGLRLIAVTGYGQASDRERSRGVGFDAHLVKPLDFDRLEKLLG